VRRVLLATAAVLAAILLQVTVLNNLPLPGGAPPDLVLVVVVALALAGGPLEGAVIGFAAGLAVDIAPPASHLVGQSALAFCLAGYGCGRLRGTLERSAWLPVTAVAAGAAAGEALYALVGLTFGDPDITLQSVRQVLPYVVIYDLLICPFVLYAVARLGGYAQWSGGAAPAGLLTGRELRLSGAGLLGLAGAGGAVRDTGTGRSPRLRPAAAHRADAWISAGRGQPGGAGARVDRPRPLRLRLGGGVAGSAAGGQRGQARPPRLLPAVHLRLAAPRRRDGVIATRRGAAGAAFSAGRAPAPAGRSAGLRGASLSGGPSALRSPRPRRFALPPPPRFSRPRRSALPPPSGQPGRAAKPRTARLRLGRRHRDAVVGGGRLASGTWSGGASRGGQMRPGSGSGATPRFRRLPARRQRSATRLRSAGPKFRRPRTRRWWPAGWRRGRKPIMGRGGKR
jgi:rod shape-determining protein MreD